MNIEKEIADALQKEIARELLIETDPSISEQRIDDIWIMCKGNPFDAPILHNLLKLAKGIV